MLPRSPVAWARIVPVALGELVLLAATADRYGYHRDELYFRVAARHPSFGYDDQPPLTPMLGRFSEWAFGSDPRGLRIVSAVAMALVVVLVALIARELGADATGQLVAALLTAASGGVMAVGHLLSTTTFDTLAWVTIAWLVALLLGGGDDRLWLLVGLTSGIALENKHLVLVLLACLAAGFALDRRLAPLRSPFLWAGVTIALVLWSPNVVWQARHGWPQLELARKIADDDPLGNRVGLVPLHVLVAGPFVVPLVVAGVVWLLRSHDARAYRPLGTAYVIVLAFSLLSGSKPYYSFPLLLVMLGAAGVVAGRWLRRRRSRVPVFGAGLLLSGVLAAVVALPFVPAADLHATPIPDINEDAIETVGWPRFADAVGAAWSSIPPDERRNAVIYAANYGEAGALWRYGPARDMPVAYSGHNAFWRFGRPSDGAAPVVVVGLGDPSPFFVGCAEAARVDNGVELDNEEQGAIVWRCGAPVRPWSQLWPELRRLNP